MITYSAENVKFPNIKRRETTAWIRRVAATYGKKVGEVGYLFCDDEHILEVNNDYLGHDYYTDIITFEHVNPKHIKKRLLRKNSKYIFKPFSEWNRKYITLRADESK